MNLMFVCTGNTCRSAMAEGLAKKLVNEKNLNINVCSSGIYAYAGEHASYNSVAVMKEYDVDILMHTSTPVADSNINEMDLILCATKGHKEQLIRMYPNIKDKIFTIKEYANYDKNGEDPDIKDPWGYDLNSYRMCAAEISVCVDRIIERITNAKGE